MPPSPDPVAALIAAGRKAEARAMLEATVKAQPRAVAPRYNLALLLIEAGRPADAARHLDQLLNVQPDFAPALFTRARLLNNAAALPLLQRCLADPRLQADALLEMGNLLRRLARPSDAAQAYRQSTRVAPGNPAGWLNLGQLLMPTDAAAALAVLAEGAERLPKSAPLQGLLGQALIQSGRPAEAMAVLRRALELDAKLAPARGHLLRACREAAAFEDEEEALAALRADFDTLVGGAQLALPVHTALFHDFTGSELLRLARAEAAWRTRGLGPAPRRTPPRLKDRLVIGYLSPDYRDHATMHLVADVLTRHDRARVKVVAYSVGPPDGSDWERMARERVDDFVDLRGDTDAAAADRIARDGVHILVDLSVYTRHARPGIAALRPAPVQVAWLGLAASSGAPWFDYVLADAVILPPEHRAHFAEAVVRLPSGYQPNLAWEPPQAPPPRAELDLPETGTVLCSFNGARKIDRATFTAWMDILGRVEGSVLWLLEPPADAMAALKDRARGAGIDPARLISAPRLKRPEHLRRLAAADLFLDTLVCGAHTTAADALRVGVPLLTVAGGRMASRVSASLLHTLGLPELIAADVDDYRLKAVDLSRDPAGLKARVLERAATSPLFDPTRFARTLEEAYTEMWRRHANGEAPADIEVSAAF